MGRLPVRCNRMFLVPLAGLVLLGMAAALLIADHSLRSSPRLLSSPARISISFGDAAMGRPDAPTVVVMVSGTCSHCMRWEREVLPVLLHGPVAAGRMRIVIRQMPFDRRALREAAFIGCLPGNLREPALGAAAQSLPLPDASDRSVISCAALPASFEAVLAVASKASAEWGIDATPTFVSGRRIVPGALSATAVEALVSDGPEGVAQPR